MLTQTVYHFVDYNLGVDISSKKGLTKKRGGVLEIVLPGKGGK